MFVNFAYALCAFLGLLSGLVKADYSFSMEISSDDDSGKLISQSGDPIYADSSALPGGELSGQKFDALFDTQKLSSLMRNILQSFEISSMSYDIADDYAQEVGSSYGSGEIVIMNDVALEDSCSPWLRLPFGYSPSLSSMQWLQSHSLPFPCTTNRAKTGGSLPSPQWDRRKPSDIDYENYRDSSASELSDSLDEEYLNAERSGKLAASRVGTESYSKEWLNNQWNAILDSQLLFVAFVLACAFVILLVTGVGMWFYHRKLVGDQAEMQPQYESVAQAESKL